MGKVIKKKLNGMNWWAKASLVLLLTLATSVFMYQGWYKPTPAAAATVTYGVTVPDVLTTGIDGLAQFPTAAASVTTAPTVRGNMSTTLTTTGASYRPTTGMTSGNATTMLKLYTPAYATAQTITAPAGEFAIRGYNATDTWTFHVYSHNPAGVAGNKTLMYSSNTTTSGTGATVVVAPTYTLVNSAMPAGYKLLLEVVYTPGGTTYTPRIYVDGTTNTTWCRLTVTETAAATGNLTFGEGTNPASANAGQASTNNALDGFTMAMSSGTSTVSSLTVTGSANFTATNIPTNGVKIYRDLGTVGTLDGSDVLLNTTSPAISGNATTVPLTAVENVTTAAVNYLVVVNLNAAATVGNTFTATISGAAGTGIGTPVDNDANSGTLTVVAGNVLTVGEGTNPANNTNAQRGSSQAIDGFTLASSTGAASVTAVTVTGNANFTATNVGTNGVKIYRDLGTVGTLDGADVLLSTTSPAIVTNATTVPLTAAEAVTTTPVNYLVVVDIAAAATLTNTITANVSALTQTGAVSVTDSDAASATLTVTAAQTLTIGNGTNPANANIQTGNSASLDAFTMAINSGTGSINSLTLTGSANFTTANIASAAVYVDNGVVGTYEAGTDTLVASSYGQTGLVGTITFSAAESVTTVAKNYLVRVTTNGGATVGNTFTGTITGATGVGIVTANDTASATLTITAGPVSTINSCGGCHGNPPVDSANASTRAAGLFAGDHGKHTAAPVSLSCASCHVDNGSSPTGNKHADGQIQIASPLRAVTGESYGQVTHAVTNSPTFSSCTTYCHSQGTSKTSNPGDTHTASLTAPITVATWGTTTLDCNGCHNSPPNYATGTLMAGVAKANSHQGTTHAAQLCTRCHNSVTGTGPYTTTTGHADGLYTVAAANVGYTYATTGGTCNATGTGCHNASTIAWGASLACLDCHTATALSAPNASSISSGTVTQRRGISTEFGLTSNHTRSRGTVTSQDCGVCHMEGNPTDGSKNTNASTAGIVGGTFHGNGVIELRDPDTGATIIAQSWSQALPSNTQGAFANKAGTPVAAFVQFSRNLATRPELETALVWPNTTNAGLYPSTTNTRFEVNAAIQKQHCLGCHDAAGAAGTGTGASASKIPTGSALNPFAATITTNGMTASLRVLDVKSQFESTNRSYHPVLYKQNNGYAGSTRMVAPWNNVAKSGTTTVFGPLITCWDCHANDGATTAITSTVTHGGALVGTNRVPLRGQTNVASTTSGTTNYCLFCHLGYTASQAGHAAGSAFVTNTQGTGRTMTGMNSTCTGCHSSIGAAGTKPARPYGAADAHGYDVKGPTAAVPNGAFAAGQGYAFIRANTFYGVTNYQQRVANVGGTAYVPTCGGATTTGSGFCGRADMGGAAPTVTKAYDPGGSF